MQRRMLRRVFPHAAAFTLLELLAVIAIILTLSVLSIPAIQSLNSAGSVTKAMADLSRTLELARVYAMANRTYVRVVLSQVPEGNGRMLPATVVVTLYSADGTKGGDMAESTEWPALNKPLVLEDLLVFDAIQGAAPDTTQDVTPSGGNVDGTLMQAFTRAIPKWGSMTFGEVIQFTPSGEATVSFEEPTRYIKIALDRPVPGSTTVSQKKNPFILRLSGVNGSIKTLRAEDMTL